MGTQVTDNKRVEVKTGLNFVGQWKSTYQYSLIILGAPFGRFFGFIDS